MTRPKRREQESSFDPDLAELPDGARWREWMGRVEAAIFASRDLVPREILTKLVGPRCNLDDLIADIVDELRALLYTCHAGCDPRAIRAAIDRLDLRGEPLYAPGQNSSSGRATPKTTSAHALALWRGAQTVAGTPAETYLRERGFDETPPATIRFLPRYRYEPRGKYFACMIAAI